MTGNYIQQVVRRDTNRHKSIIRPLEGIELSKQLSPLLVLPNWRRVWTPELADPRPRTASTGPVLLSWCQRRVRQAPVPEAGPGNTGHPLASVGSRVWPPRCVGWTQSTI